MRWLLLAWIIVALGSSQQRPPQPSFGPIVVDTPHGRFEFREVTLWPYSDALKAPKAEVSGILDNRTGAAWRYVVFQLAVTCPGAAERSFPLVLGPVTENSVSQFADNSYLAASSFTPCSADQIRITFTEAKSMETQQEQRNRAAAVEREAQQRAAALELETAKLVAEDKARAARVTKKFGSVDAFKAVLAKVMADSADSFRDIIGTRYLHSPSIWGSNSFATRVKLPGLQCRIRGLDVDGNDHGESGHAAVFIYLCFLGESGNLTPTMSGDYEDLVDIVESSTDLHFPQQWQDTFMKVETRPGSGEFARSRTTLFSKGPLWPEKSYITVSLDGGFGMGGSWHVELKVGSHFPN